EKVLAARRLGINEVILPKQNGKNINEDLTPELRQNLTVHLVSTIDEVLALALQPISTDVLRPPKKSHRTVPQSAPSRTVRGYGEGRPEGRPLPISLPPMQT